MCRTRLDKQPNIKLHKMLQNKYNLLIYFRRSSVSFHHICGTNETTDTCDAPTDCNITLLFSKVQNSNFFSVKCSYSCKTKMLKALNFLNIYLQQFSLICKDSQFWNICRICSNTFLKFFEKINILMGILAGSVFTTRITIVPIATVPNNCRNHDFSK